MIDTPILNISKFNLNEVHKYHVKKRKKHVALNIIARLFRDITTA